MVNDLHSTHSSGSSCNGLIVPERFVPKRNVVHATLAGGTGTKRLEDDVDEPLGSQDVAADDGGVVPRHQYGALGQDDFDRAEAALVEGNVTPDHATEAVDDGRVGDGRRSVAVAPHLIARAAKINQTTSYEKTLTNR